MACGADRMQAGPVDVRQLRLLAERKMEVEHGNVLSPETVREALDKTS
jgi:hypothetical protein